LVLKGCRGMKTCYKKLWKILIDRDMTKTQLCHLSGVSSSSMAKLTKGESVTTTVLLKICNVLDCEIGDIVEITYGHRGGNAD